MGQQVAQILADVEDNTIVKTRRALFGEDFAHYYELCKNRLIFLDGGKDDVFFLEHYVLLGNYARDPDRFEAMDALFQEFLREAGITVADDPAHKEAVETHTALLESVQAIRNEITNLEEQREATRKRLERGDSFFNKFLSSDNPADLEASLHDIESRLQHQELKLEELDPQVEDARQKLDFFRKGKASRLGEFLDDPENAQRLFDPKSGPEDSAPLRAQLLTRLLDRLEQHEMLFHVLASYEVRPIAAEYCPPLHLQQLRRALVSKDELKQVERVVKQVPARKLSLRTIEELSRRIQRYSRDEMKEFVLRFASDFFRLHRDLRDAEHLTAGMERINLVTTEKARELSRMNNRLYECVLQEEARPAQDNVISHVIIKADVRGSTRMTQDLLSRGLNPASHFSLNLHEPVKKLLDRFDAKKVFIEGDAIILAIFETESSAAYARPVAKACILSRQILAVCNSYNERASSSDFPALELGLGVAFQGDAPTYWVDGDSRIMISKALNLSDRLSGCAKLAKRMLAKQKSHFSVFQFLNTMEGASAEELDEFLVRYNMNGIELNEEGFKKLSEEISLDSIETKLDLPWGKQNVTLFYGEVPLGESVELLVLRKSFARQLLPDGKVGRATEHCYYEVCTTPALYDLVVLGQPNPDVRAGGAFGLRPEEIVLGGGRPVLVIPYAGDFAEVGQRVLVAWNGSREAARTLHDAMFLLEGAEAVTVIEADPPAAGAGPPIADAAALAAMLTRRGIKATAETTTAGDIGVENLLLSRAADLSADLLVMGAYGHSRLREFVLGGVSRGIFRHMTVPVLMAH